MIYFTADLHLGHEAILRHMPLRRHCFGTIEHMNDAIIDKINLVVGRKDALWILGDLFWKARTAGHFRQRINCREVHVVQGNHDAGSLRQHFSSMALMVAKVFDGVPFHMCHFPMRSWAKMEHGGRHLHGHCHGRLARVRGALDVGIDNACRLFGTWRPFSLSEVIQLTSDWEQING